MVHYSVSASGSGTERKIMFSFRVMDMFSVHDQVLVQGVDQVQGSSSGSWLGFRFRFRLMYLNQVYVKVEGSGFWFHLTQEKIMSK